MFGHKKVAPALKVPAHHLLVVGNENVLQDCQCALKQRQCGVVLRELEEEFCECNALWDVRPSWIIWTG